MKILRIFYVGLAVLLNGPMQSAQMSQLEAQRLAAGDGMGCSMEHKLAGHTASVTSVVYSPDGRHVVTGSDDKTVRIWNAETGAMERELYTGEVRSVVYSPDGSHIAMGSWDGTVIIWDVKTGVAECTLVGNGGQILSVAYSTDGKHLATGSVDGTVMVWNVETKEQKHELAGHGSAVWSVAFSPDGKYLATGSWDKTAILWDVESGALERRLGGEGFLRLFRVGHRNGVLSVAYSPDGKHLATGSADGTVMVWDVATGTMEYQLMGHVDYVHSVMYSSDERHLATASADHTAMIWNVETRVMEYKLVGHSAAVLSVAYSPNGRYLATGSADKTARIWNVEVASVSGVSCTPRIEAKKHEEDGLLAEQQLLEKSRIKEAQAAAREAEEKRLQENQREAAAWAHVLIEAEQTRLEHKRLHDEAVEKERKAQEERNEARKAQGAREEEKVKADTRVQEIEYLQERLQKSQRENEQLQAQVAVAQEGDRVAHAAAAVRAIATPYELGTIKVGFDGDRIVGVLADGSLIILSDNAQAIHLRQQIEALQAQIKEITLQSGQQVGQEKVSSEERLEAVQNQLEALQTTLLQKMEAIAKQSRQEHLGLADILSAAARSRLADSQQDVSVLDQFRPGMSGPDVSEPDKSASGAAQQSLQGQKK